MSMLDYFERNTLTIKGPGTIIREYKWKHSTRYVVIRLHGAGREMARTHHKTLADATHKAHAIQDANAADITIGRIEKAVKAQDYFIMDHYGVNLWPTNVTCTYFSKARVYRHKVVDFIITIIVVALAYGFGHWVGGLIYGIIFAGLTVASLIHRELLADKHRQDDKVVYDTNRMVKRY